MDKNYLKYGFGIAGTMIFYFLALKLIGLHQYPILSAANGLIIGSGIFYALKNYKKSVKNFKYEDGFQLGLFTGVLATIVFVIFIAIYIYHIDTQFAVAILDSWGLSYDKGALILIFSIFIMGFSTTFILTLAFMQLLKDSWNQ